MAIGSNAPLITNALVAWPPPPSSARLGAASPPGTARNTRLSFVAPLSAPFTSPPLQSHPSAFPGASPLSGYGAPRPDPQPAPSTSSSGSSTPQRQKKEYPPPKAPLSPTQLGRIAQSFGIAIPNLGDPASPFPSPSRNPHDSPRPPRTPISPRGGRASTPFAPQAPSHVVAVIPPLRLLPRVPDADPETERERRRRWRRGRLIPLQATLGSMLVSIAREFGLPSTIGVNVYISDTESRRGSTSGFDEEDTAGPEITPQTWTTFFAHAARKSVSPNTSPINTPRKRNTSAATFGAMMGHSTANSEPPQQDRVKSLSHSTTDDSPSRSVSSASASSFSPRTPASLGNMPTMPVFGTIEFDIDPITARWFDAWMESGGPSRRLGPGAEIAAMRELTLVERLNDPRPKFLRQMEEERERAERLAAERAATEALEAARLAAERDEAEREAEQLRLEVEAAEREAERLRVEREEAEREAERLELQRIALEKERSETEAQSPVPNGTIDGSPMNSNIQIEDIDLSADEGPGLKGLSSPINLGHNSQPVSPGMLSPTSPHSVNDYRASGMIMADQLTTLEKMVRDLSPKESRFTQRAPPKTSPRGPRSPPVTMSDLPARGSSRLPYLAGSHKSTDSSGSVPSPILTPQRTEAWPAVPFKQIESPQSPGLQEYFNNKALPPPAEPAPRMQSAETTYRAQPVGLDRPKSQAPPKRPARPPTPDLTMPDTIPHVLPTEYVDAIKQSTHHTSPTLQSVPVLGNLVHPSRPNSISIKAMRRQTSHKNMRPKERAHAYAVANTRGDYHPREDSSTSYTSYASTRSRGSRGDSLGSNADAQHVYQPFPTGDDFGQTSYDQPHQYGSLPTRRDGGFTSRFFSFGGRKARENEERPMTIVHISSPIATTVKHVQVSPAELAASGAAGGMSAGPLPPTRPPPPPIAPPHHASLPPNLSPVPPTPTGTNSTDPTVPNGVTPASPTPLVPPSAPFTNNTSGNSNLSPQSLVGPATIVGFSTPNPSTSTLGPSVDGHRSSIPNSPTSPRHVRRKPVPGIEGDTDSILEGSIGSHKQMNL